MFKRLIPFLFLHALPLLSQSNSGELQLHVSDPSGIGVQSTLEITSQANSYRRILTTDEQGDLEIQHLPYGLYLFHVEHSGFAPISEPVSIRSSLPVKLALRLSLTTVSQSVTVTAEKTLLDPEQAGSVNRIGSNAIEHRLSSLPGRSLQDLVNSQPGWLYEGNAVLHPRGSEYQTQFVIDGIPLTDNRSPSFGPEIEADGVQSLNIYTAGIPAEYGRKLGGVIEVNTIQDPQAGLHGQAVLSGGSFVSAGAFLQAQYGWKNSTLGGSASGSRTDHYLNPVVPENYSNTGTLGDFSVNGQRNLTPGDRVSFVVRHEFSRYDLPNEFLQQAAGQRQTAENIETMGVLSYQHVFSSTTLANLRGMVRDNATDFNSNANSTPIEVFQHNGFREGYFNAAVTVDRGRHEWKFGLESDNTFLQENFRYLITDTNRFDSGTPGSFSFLASRPDLEQAVFVQDHIRLGDWTIEAGLRWDHYQLLLNRKAFQPRLSASHYFKTVDAVVHFSYDRVFQTPSFENILLSSSAAVEALSPNFLRFPVEPSQGDYYEAGFTKAFAGKIRLDATYFRRFFNNFADDSQIDNTTISFPISFRKAIVYGVEGKLTVPDWRRFSGFVSYSYSVGNSWYPATGGLFLGNNAAAAATQLTGHFPVSQDQRNTLRGRVRYQVEPRFWIAGGVQYDSGLPFQFNGDSATVLAQYGQQVLDRIDFSRGRIDPALLFNATAGADIYQSDRVKMHFQADGENLTNMLDVLDFGGLFSGNAIGPSRSFSLRLTANF